MELEAPALNPSNVHAGSSASANTTYTSTASASSGQRRRQNLQPRRSSLINASADALAAHFLDTTSATASFEVSRQATLSQPTAHSLEHLAATASRNPSTTTLDTTLSIGRQRPHQAGSSITKARRHTLAGEYQTLLTTLAGGTSSRISGGATVPASNGNDASEAARLSRINLVPTSSATLPTSNHTSVPVVPVPLRPSRIRSHSTRTLALAPAPETGQTPHIPPQPLLHTQSDSQVPTTDCGLYIAGQRCFTHPPPAPIEIPVRREPIDLHPVIPLTARPREGLHLPEPLLESHQDREARPALLPYYTQRPSTPRTSTPRPSSVNSCASSGSLSSKSSAGDLPAGALSPLSTQSKKSDPRAREGHRRCPPSPSRRRLSRRSPRRPSTHSYGQHLRPSEPQMRLSSTTSGVAYTPTSPLSPGSPRNITAAMQQNKNADARSRRPQQFQLPIPRFHPAVYQSPSASNPSTATNSPRNPRTPVGLQPPMSPRTQRQTDQARAALMETYQEILRAGGASGAAPLAQKLPGTPSLLPARSPGEATPLALEDGPNDYLTAGAARRGQHATAASQREMVERMIRDEEERRNGNSSLPSSAPVSPAGGP